MKEILPMLEELDSYIKKINIEKPTILSFSPKEERFNILDL